MSIWSLFNIVILAAKYRNLVRKLRFKFTMRQYLLKLTFDPMFFITSFGQFMNYSYLQNIYTRYGSSGRFQWNISYRFQTISLLSV